MDIYFGPKAPAGKESNWVPTNPSGQFEVLFRFYGPEKPLFDKTWKLPDIERIAVSDEERSHENLRIQICACLLLAAISIAALVQAQPAPPTPAGNSVPVTADNFIRAESDTVFTGLVSAGWLRQVLPQPRADADRQPHRPAPQPRHALFNGACSTSMPGR